MLEIEKVAWAAGLLEGEGTIFSKSDLSKRGTRCVALTSTDEDIVRRFHRIVKVGNVQGPYVQKANGRPRKPFWRWQCSAWKDVEPLLRTTGEETRAVHGRVRIGAVMEGIVKAPWSEDVVAALNAHQADPRWQRARGVFPLRVHREKRTRQIDLDE